ncbi:hypothetical protein BGX33_004283 [Mortierella sp. NVP41]|nr:hypothetical protein BGX33_004283 [Mortierella sp. NVP41]
MPSLKASHELREAGQNHQLRDEIEYILDGIRSKDRLKIRRSSCLDLARSMLKLEFAALIRTLDYMSIIFETIHTDRDPYNDLKDIARQSGVINKGQKVLVKSIVLSSMTGIIDECVTLQDVETLSLIEQDPTFINAVINILVDDLAWIKLPSATPDTKLPTDSGAAITRFQDTGDHPCNKLQNSMNLMLHALRLLINVTNGFEPCCENLAQSGSISVLTQNIIQFYGHCRNYNPGESDMATTMEGTIIGTGGRQDPIDEGERIHWTRADSRSDSGLSFEMMTPGATPSRRDEFKSSTDDLEAALKAEGLLSNRLVEKEVKIENDANGWYDILLLSIGLLINMLETNVRRRKQLTDEDCNAIGDCFIKECQCDKSTDALERLVEIYNTEATISEMTENQVLAAYLALLLGCAVGGNAENETRLYRAIHEQSLVPMLDLLREFMAAHQSVTGQVEDHGRDYDGDETMTSQRDFQPHGTAMERSSSMMSLTLESDQQHREGDDDIEAANSSVLADRSGEISFKTPGGLETQQSFLQIIEVLQRIELRHSGTPQ